MTHCVSQVAATIIQKIQHPCDFREAGCDQRCDIKDISDHEESCRFRLVHCPHWACDEQISVTDLTSHVLSSECGDNYMSSRLPYQEEIEYTRALDDHDGRSFWRPSLLQFENITFYLQVEKLDKQWYFYVQMEVRERTTLSGCFIKLSLFPREVLPSARSLRRSCQSASLQTPNGTASLTTARSAPSISKERTISTPWGAA